jgi:hypothetical protein
VVGTNHDVPKQVLSIIAYHYRFEQLTISAALETPPGATEPMSLLHIIKELRWDAGGALKGLPWLPSAMRQEIAEMVFVLFGYEGGSVSWEPETMSYDEVRNAISYYESILYLSDHWKDVANVFTWESKDMKVDVSKYWHDPSGSNVREQWLDNLCEAYRQQLRGLSHTLSVADESTIRPLFARPPPTLQPSSTGASSAAQLVTGSETSTGADKPGLSGSPNPSSSIVKELDSGATVMARQIALAVREEMQSVFKTLRIPRSQPMSSHPQGGDPPLPPSVSIPAAPPATTKKSKKKGKGKQSEPATTSGTAQPVVPPGSQSVTPPTLSPHSRSVKPLPMLVIMSSEKPLRGSQPACSTKQMSMCSSTTMSPFCEELGNCGGSFLRTLIGAGMALLTWCCGVLLTPFDCLLRMSHTKRQNWKQGVYALLRLWPFDNKFSIGWSLGSSAGKISADGESSRQSRGSASPWRRRAIYNRTLAAAWEAGEGRNRYVILRLYCS